MSAYAGKSIAEIVHDYAVVRGDLVEQYARDQLIGILEDRQGRAVEAFRAAAIAELNAVTPADWVLAGHHAGQVAARIVADIPAGAR